MRPDRIDATGKTLRRIASEPMTWLPFAPVAAAYAFIGAPWWACAAAAGAIGAGVVAWWKRRWTSLYDRVRVENLRASLAAENAELESAVKKLTTLLDWRWFAELRRGAAEEVTAGSIAAVLSRKRSLEARILDDAILTADEEDLSRIVSELFASIRQELERLAALSQSRNADRDAAARDSLAALGAACRTLHEASESAEQLLDPLAGLREAELPRTGRAIERSTGQLRQRMEQAEAVQRRVAASLHPPK